MRPFTSFFRSWRYFCLLAALVALLVIQPIASSLGILESLFDVLLVIVMFVLILTLAKDKSWRRAGFILLVPAAILSIASHFLTASAQNVSVSIGHAIAAFFFVVVTGKIVASIFASRELTLDSIFGAICGYLLLGVAWALMYTMLHAASPDSFQISETIRPHFDQGEYSRNVFIYYSFVTLSTVGYGDVTPLSIPARTLSWVEAVAGQLYLAVLVTGLIGALITSKGTPKRRG